MSSEEDPEIKVKLPDKKKQYCSIILLKLHS